MNDRQPWIYKRCFTYFVSEQVNSKLQVLRTNNVNSVNYYRQREIQ